jgi:hypothetical protein
LTAVALSLLGGLVYSVAVELRAWRSRRRRTSTPLLVFDHPCSVLVLDQAKAERLLQASEEPRA